MKMFVLAGGFGTRLQSVVANVPKALAPIGEMPFLHFQLEHWVSQGVRSFVFLLHHQADSIRSFLDEQRKFILHDCDVSVVVEAVPLDTGGAIANAVATLGIESDVLVCNADTWLGGGVNDLIRADAPSIAVVRLDNTSRYGQVMFDSEFKVTAFSEKSGLAVPGWINAGVCRLRADMFKSWGGQPFSLEKTLFAHLVSRGILRAVPMNTDFIDIGVPNDYFRFCRWIEAGRKGRLCN